MLKGNQIVKELFDRLSSVQNLSVTYSPISGRGKVFELHGRFNGLIFVKGIGHSPHRWGITKNIVESTELKKNPWCVILLHDTAHTGYIISSTEYHNRIKGLWPQSQGDWKITEGRSLEGLPHFSSVEELTTLFESQLNQRLSGLTTIQEVLKNIETAPAYGGESSLHKRMKEYVASHPLLLGLKENVKSFIEFPFPSGDRVDIAFDLGSNHWVIVEVEIEGFNSILVGLFQAVKYRALQKAVLRLQELEGSVSGFVVARTIPEEIKRLSNLLDIETAELRL